MNKHSLPQTEQHDTDLIADRAALAEVNGSELEAVNGGFDIDGPWCGTHPPTPFPPPRAFFA
jgi:hypothetical protein